MIDNSSDFVSSKLISVVIQGPLYRHLEPDRGIHSCISSIRTHLPEAEIVVSTWNDEEVSDLTGCICIRSQKPFSFTDVAGREVNTNRQIVSTYSGIKAATRPYVLKFRADHKLVSAFIAQINEYSSKVSLQEQLFHHPITVTNFFIRNPAKVPMLFHLSDLVHFGMREDLLDFWSQPLINFETHFISGSPSKNPFGNFLGYTNLKIIPEQALILNWLKTKGLKFSLNNVCEVRGELLEVWENILIQNFRVLSWQEAGIDYPQRFFRGVYPVSTVYSPKDLQKISDLSVNGKRIRRVQVWLNQYIFGCFTRIWFLSLISILLFSIFPEWSKRLRAIWRNFKKIN